MTVEFISLINVWESSEVHPRPGGAPDAAYIRKYARYLEDGGFDYTLVAYATDDLAWEKAHHTLAAVEQAHRGGGFLKASLGPGAPQNVGSQRLLEIAARGEVHDRALWMLPAQVTGAMGASTALVGSYETVAASILDYVDLGADLISIRGYDNLTDAIDYGRFVLPLVRQELAHREATGQRGAVVPQPPVTSAPRKAS
jgi:alkanesulfonate monooxygenase